MGLGLVSGTHIKALALTSVAMMCGRVSNGRSVDKGVGEMWMRDMNELQVGAFKSPFRPVSSFPIPVQT